MPMTQQDSSYQTNTTEPTFLADTWTKSLPWHSLLARRWQICNGSLFTTLRQGRISAKSFSLKIFSRPKSSTFKHWKEYQTMSGKAIDFGTHNVGSQLKKRLPLGDVFIQFCNWSIEVFLFSLNLDLHCGLKVGGCEIKFSNQTSNLINFVTETIKVRTTNLRRFPYLS